MICAGFDRFARRHESFLIAGLRPIRPDSGNNDLNFVAKFAPQKACFERARNQTIDSSRDTQTAQSEDMSVELLFDSDLIESLLGRSGTDGHAQDRHLLFS